MKYSDPQVWNKSRNDMSRYMGFTAPLMADALGVKCASPFLETAFLQWALSTVKQDCVGEREVGIFWRSVRYFLQIIQFLENAV